MSQLCWHIGKTAYANASIRKAYFINIAAKQLNARNNEVTLLIGFERNKKVDPNFNDTNFFKIESADAKLTDTEYEKILKPVPNVVSQWQILQEGTVKITMTNFAEEIDLQAWAMKEGKIIQAPFFNRTLPVVGPSKEN